MAHHNETGKKGEQLAATWLQQRGYLILHINWRYTHCEIDIIASLNDTLHFIEVKTRQTETFGYPEESVSRKKMISLMNGAAEFLFQHPEWKKVQYDILAITQLKNQPTKYFLIEDVYYSQ